MKSMTIDTFKEILYDIADEVKNSRKSLAFDFENPEFNTEDYLIGFADGNDYFAEYMVALINSVAEGL